MSKKLGSLSLKLLAVTLIFMPLASCTTLISGISLGTAKTPVVVDTACSAFKPISYSKTDTPETVKEVRAHNRVYSSICPAPSS